MPFYICFLSLCRFLYGKGSLQELIKNSPLQQPLAADPEHKAAVGLVRERPQLVDTDACVCGGFIYYLFEHILGLPLATGIFR